MSKNRSALVVTVNKRAGRNKRTLCLPLSHWLVLIKTNWVVNSFCSQQTLSETERERKGERMKEKDRERQRETERKEREKGRGTVNHWVHMEECHLVNMVPGLLMILAGKQASHRPRREKLSPTITPALPLCFMFLRTTVAA